MMSRVIAAIAFVVISLLGDPFLQSTSDFAGRWQLLSTDGLSSEAAEAMFISVGPSARVISIGRDGATGVQMETYNVGSRDTALQPDANWMGAVLVLRSSASYDGRGAASGRQETWSVDADGLLHIVVADQASSGKTSTTHLLYRRVLPEPARSDRNLIGNGDADLGRRSWLAVGDASVDACDGDPCFVVRNHGSFEQAVLLPSDAAGKYLAIVGSGASERVNADGSTTGLPYLYGFFMAPDGAHILRYLQGQNMRARTTEAGAWVTLSGVFQVPEGATRLVFDLDQAEARGVPQNGSVARFDRVGAYVFPTEDEARAFVATWRGRE